MKSEASPAASSARLRGEDGITIKERERLRGETSQRAGTKGVALRVAFAVALSLIFAYALATRIHLSDLAALLKHVNPVWLGAGVVTLGVANFARAARFHLLDGQRHSLARWWVTTQVYNLATSTLPGGLGELVTAVLFRRVSVGGWAGAFRLLIVARLLDLVTLLGLFVAAMWALGLAWTTPIGWVSCSTAALLGLVALALLVPRTQVLALKTLLRLAPLLSRLPLASRRQSLVTKAQSTLETLIAATGTTSRRAWLGIAAWSVVMGIVSASIVMVVLHGFGGRLSLVASCASYGLYVLLQLIPLQGIAGVGTQSARWAVALALVGIGVQEATVDSVALYLCLYAIVALWAACAGAVAGVQQWMEHREVATSGVTHGRAEADYVQTGEMPLGIPVSMLHYPREYLVPDDERD